MRKILAAAAFGLVLGVAGASSSDDQTPEGRAYMGFSFGGERIAPRDFHYGLRLDHDSRFVEGPVAPLMQLDFTRRGLNAARINGLSVIRQQYRLKQAEESAETPAEAPAEAPAAAPAEDVAEVPAEGGAAKPGFFSRIGAFFGGLFGGGAEEQAPAEETAGGEAPGQIAAGEEVSEGMFLNFSVVDWGLLAVGAVGLGVAVGEVSNGDESDQPGAAAPPPPPPPLGGGPGGGGLPGGLGGLGGLAGGLGGFLPGGLTSPLVGGDAEHDAEYRKWLDGGTGQMGDLGGG